MHYKQHIESLLKSNKEQLYRTNNNKTAIALIELFEETINNFNYDSTDSIIHFFSMFDILVDLLKSNRPLQVQFYNKFTFIHNTIKTLLHAKPKDSTKTIDKNYNILKNLMNKMENTMLRIYYDNPAEYDPNKEEFIHYIVFKLKNINFLADACEKFPYIVNSVDEFGIPLIEKVLDQYLNSLEVYLSKMNLGPLDDLIYYDKVFQTIMKSQKIKIDDYTKSLMLNKIKIFLQEKNYDSNRHKEKLSFFTNNIISIIENDNIEMSLDFLSYKYEIHNKFKEAHNFEANRIYIQNSSVSGPVSNRKIYTFDGIDAKEIDDGLSITYEDGIYHLGIHIANPPMYIPNTSILMDEAKKRTTSIYMGNECIPLFPLKLSGDLMSMNEGKNTYCMSYYYDIDARTGELINFEIKNEICKIEKNLTYDYFNKCIDEGTEDQDFFYTLINLSNISEILKRVYNENSLYQEFQHTNVNGLSQSIIESCMIYNNYQVAKLFSNNDLPFIYRCHTINEQEIKQLSDLQERLKLRENTNAIVRDIEMIKNIFPKAYYSRINTGHFGLGIEYYSHTTSPLRRLADNIAIECINKFILSKYQHDDIEIMKDRIDETTEFINSKRSSIDDYEIQYLKIKGLYK